MLNCYAEVDISSFETGMKRLSRNAKQRAMRSVRDSLNIIKKDSLLQVPKDTGSLAGSIYIDVIQVDDVVVGEIGYGGDKVNSRTGIPVADYMIQQHEDLTIRHKNGKAKFLEDPIVAYAKRARKDWAKGLSMGD